MKPGRDCGSASLMLLSLGVAVVMLGTVVAFAGSAVVDAHRAARVADMAALAAAAQVFTGVRVACGFAGTVATANHAELVSCRQDGLDMVVGVRVVNSTPTDLLAEPIALARAGPVAG